MRSFIWHAPLKTLNPIDAIPQKANVNAYIKYHDDISD